MRKQFFSKFQFGFKPNHITEHVVLAIVEDAYRAINIGQVLCVVALDLRKAFPSVARQLLLDKLKRAGVERTMCEKPYRGNV